MPSFTVELRTTMECWQEHEIEAETAEEAYEIAERESRFADWENMLSTADNVRGWVELDGDIVYEQG